MPLRKASTQTTDEEDGADGPRDPGADAINQEVLQADDGHRADHWTGEGAHAAEQGQQYHFARQRPVRVGQGGEAEHQGLQRAGQAGDCGRRRSPERWHAARSCGWL